MWMRYDVLGAEVFGFERTPHFIRLAGKHKFNLQIGLFGPTRGSPVLEVKRNEYMLGCPNNGYYVHDCIS